MTRRISIADDPDSWGKPEDLEKVKPLKVGALATCQLCGVVWMYHDSSTCVGERGGYEEDGA